ncbi:MAG: hypothetical protein ACYDHH_12055 [Solirubrobacteraceae bacterium]
MANAHVKTIAPPGNSAITQYTEVVPTAKGNQPTSTIHPGSPGSSGTGGPGASGGSPGSGGSAGASAALPQATVRAFAKQGKDGLRAAALAASAPGPSQRSGKHSSTGSGSSPIATLVNAATGSSSSTGLRSSLLVILLVVAIGGTTLGLRRRRAH